MKKISKNIKWIIFVVLMFLFVIISALMVTDKICTFDDYIYNFISKCINPTMTKIVIIITNFANPIVLVLVTLLVSYIVGIKKKDKKTAIMFCLSLCIITILNYLLKGIFARTRPELINIIRETGYSFPSGHSSVGMAFYGYIIYIVNLKCNNKKIRILSSVLISILILLIGLSRVYLGVHYASDVIAAFLLSISYLIIYTHIAESITKKQELYVDCKIK